MKKLVLYSGGLDSSVCLAENIAEGHEVVAITFSYGQKNSEELRKGGDLSSRWNIPHIRKHLEINNNDTESEIPGRNLLFLSHALSEALSMGGVDAIVFGAEPESSYSDSSYQFLIRMTHLFRLFGIELEYPVKNAANKEEILHRALQAGVPIECIHSSLTNEVDGRDKTSARFLRAWRHFFPKIDYTKACEDLFSFRFHSSPLVEYYSSPLVPKSPFDLTGHPRDTVSSYSYKFWAALFFYWSGSLDTLKKVPVWTTGNWAQALAYFGWEGERHYTDNPEELRSHRILNTDNIYCMYGMKQALSWIPRDRYSMQEPILVPSVQGNLAQAVRELGFKVVKVPVDFKSDNPRLLKTDAK